MQEHKENRYKFKNVCLHFETLEMKEKIKQNKQKTENNKNKSEK